MTPGMAWFRSGWAIQIGVPDDRCLLRSINRANSESAPESREKRRLQQRHGLAAADNRARNKRTAQKLG
jgi:hypothetical protein